MRLKRGAAAVLAFTVLGLAAPRAAETTYPFVGSWVRSDRSCSATPARERVYTAKEVVSPRSRCSIRRIAAGSGGFELFERCERPNEKPSHISEIIRMTGSDSMVLNRQTARLKLSRSLHFTRCAPAAAPGALRPPAR